MTRLIHVDPVSAEIAGINDWSKYGINEKAPKNNKNSKSK